MSEPTLFELMESPCEWTDYSCESIVHMAADEIERLQCDLYEAGEEYKQRQEWAAEQSMTVIKELQERIDKLETIIATHADPTGDDEETVALILQCYENWSALGDKDE